MRGPLTLLEHRKGVEPSPSAWKANVLTVKYDRCIATAFAGITAVSAIHHVEVAARMANRLFPVCYGMLSSRLHHTER